MRPACIEVGDGFPAVVPVRDSKNSGGPALIFESAAWSSFATAAKGGEFTVRAMRQHSRDRPSPSGVGRCRAGAQAFHNSTTKQSD
ncbi:DUF397 domain-containing protein [Streptomyces sp. NPDC088141]